MRCCNCSHLLWNQPAPAPGSARACSECGTGYAVSDYEFVRGRVEFRCPHCEQAYYGTSPKGQLEPREFLCVRCGAAIGMESCVLRPVAGVADEQAMLAEPVPWLTGRGFYKRLMGTIRMGFARPGRIGPGLVTAPDTVRATLYLAIIQWIASVPGALMGLGLVVLAGYMGSGGAVTISGGWAPLFLYWLLQFALAPLWMAATAAVTALAVGATLTGIATRADPSSVDAAHAGAWANPAIEPAPVSELGPRRVYELICYASGALFAQVIPVCGGLVSTVAWTVCATLAVSGAVPASRRVPAVIVLVVCMLFGAVCQWVLGFAASMLLGSF